MKKFSFFLLFFSFTFLISFFSFYECYSFSIKFFSISQNFFNNYDLIFVWDTSSIVFFFMVCLVTFFVSLYSELYMEHYNNKKFFFLMMLFFLSMILLSSSGSFIIFMVGWDGLGISSICLIMFYPNKTTLFNSIMTMFFNRLGDVMLIISLSILTLESSNMYFLNYSNLFWFFFIICVCSFTKSAQFPLSSWLPAAMSAPTPISAMVHSSTLVTAGIFLVSKLIYYLTFYFLCDFLTLFSVLTFILGGFMANMEMDFKKIVAFSTMSQISMIMFFCSLSFIGLALSHMVFHAFFKTMLFCCSGLFFIFHFSNQSRKFLLSFSSMKVLNSLFFFSIFSMTGLIFSSSFFTKDLILESFCSNFKFFYFFFLILGSVLTLFYCCKLMDCCFSWFTNSFSFYSKYYMFNLGFIFLIFVLYAGNFFKFIFFFEFFPFLSSLDLKFILFIFLIPLIFPFLIEYKLFYFITIELSYMKFFSFSLYSYFFNKKHFKQMILSDHMFFKPFYLNLLIFTNLNNLTKLTFYLFFIVFFFISFFYI